MDILVDHKIGRGWGWEACQPLPGEPPEPNIPPVPCRHRALSVPGSPQPGRLPAPLPGAFPRASYWETSACLMA